uniref:Uncharacterized protein n=1 Tax=Spermophilus dauricus TaxID=99837 RepID=A0A8C9Q747_SPEDA
IPIAWHLVLVTMVLGLARTGPGPTIKPPTTRVVCHIDRFKSLSAQELECSLLAASPWTSPVPVTCSMSLVRSLFSTLFPPGHPCLSSSLSPLHPVASQAELALTLKVLGTLSDAALGGVLDQPLCTLYPSAPSSWPVSVLGPRPSVLWLWSPHLPCAPAPLTSSSCPRTSAWPTAGHKAQWLPLLPLQPVPTGSEFQEAPERVNEQETH